MRLTRRTFLGAGLAGLGAAMALPRSAAAAGTSNLLIVFARGGWDPVWALDPKTLGGDVDAPPTGTVKKFLNNKISVLTDPARPGIEAFFAAWANQCAVVRGIQVGSIAHFSCHVRMMTGTRTELNPDIGAITGVVNGDGLPLPYADIGGGAYAGRYAAQMGRLGLRNQLVTLLNRKKAYDPAPGIGYADAPLATTTADEMAAIRAYAEARADEAAKIRGAHGDNAHRLGDYRGSFQRADDLRAIPELQQLPLSGNTSLVNQTELAITLLKQSSRAVYLDSGQDWDTHDNIDDQGEAHDALFTDLGNLMTRLQEESLLASTVVVVMSEMGRTPKLNAPYPAGGKDHWPVTSAMVLGAGVAPGAYGLTDAKLNAVDVDLTTGKPDGTTVPLEYDNFAAGLLTLVGVDPQEWIPDVTPMQAFIA